MSYEWFISLRYLKAKRKQTFISIITLISVAGVALGVAALIIVISVMSGFDRDLKSKILGTKAHLVITDSSERGLQNYQEIMQRISKTPGILACAPFVTAQAMLQSEDYLQGIVLLGIDSNLEPKVSNVKKNLITGRLPDSQADEVVLGNQLSYRVGVGNGGTMILFTKVAKTPMGLVPKTSSVKVVGIFESGMYEYDANLAYTSLSAAQRMYDLPPDMATGIACKLEDVDHANALAKKLQAQLGNLFSVKSWDMLNKELFSALALEKTVMFIILLLIVVVAAFNIISTLIMMTMEKSRDIAILKTMGATPTSITMIFLFEGLIIGIVGTLAGTALGLFSCWALDRYKFITLPQDIYYIDKLPVNVEPLMILIITVSAMLLCLAAAVYPAWQAGRLEPVEALRYE